MEKIKKIKNIKFIGGLVLSVIVILLIVIITINSQKTNLELEKVTLSSYENSNVNLEYSDIWKFKETIENEDGSGTIRFRMKDGSEIGDVFVQYDKDFSGAYKNTDEFYKTTKAEESEKTLDNGDVVHTWELVEDDIIFRYDYKSTTNGDVIISSQYKKEYKNHASQIIESITITNKIPLDTSNTENKED